MVYHMKARNNIKKGLEENIERALKSLSEGRMEYDAERTSRDAFDAGVILFSKILAYTADLQEKTEFLFQVPNRYIKESGTDMYSVRKDRALKTIAKGLNARFYSHKKELEKHPRTMEQYATRKVLGWKDVVQEEEIEKKTDRRAEMIAAYLTLMRDTIRDSVNKDAGTAKKTTNAYDSAIRKIHDIYKKYDQSERTCGMVMKHYRSKTGI
jgi:hypothetical protein